MDARKQKSYLAKDRTGMSRVEMVIDEFKIQRAGILKTIQDLKDQIEYMDFRTSLQSFDDAEEACNEAIQSFIDLLEQPSQHTNTKLRRYEEKNRSDFGARRP